MYNRGVRGVFKKNPYLWLVSAVTGLLVAMFFHAPFYVSALNIIEYKDTISDSGPSEQSNHTFEFILNTAISPGSTIEITPPAGFTVMSTSTFAERNVELFVNGVKRVSSSTASAGVDMIEITAGSPGFFRYTLAPDYSIAAGSRLKIKIGNHTTYAQQFFSEFSTTTGTTTIQGDIEPIINSSITGVHKVDLKIYDGALVASTDFVIFLNEKVNMPGADTRESVPPYRFNPQPVGAIGGTTLSVEISLETDELAICKYDVVPDVDFTVMPNTFANTGQIFHSHIVAISPDTVNRFYVRCIDDEGNYNIDDFQIVFTVNEMPQGTANTVGSTSGDGTGSGNSGTGSGGGDGGESGTADGEAPLEGGSAGAGGSGGGGGGGSGDKTSSTAGGGFESADAPYRSGDGQVIISGYAYPNSKVGILVDGNFVQTINSNGSGAYSVTLDAIARGVYTFGVYAEGPDKVRSSTFSTSFTVTGARSTSLSNINVAPSIKVSPDPVQL